METQKLNILYKLRKYACEGLKIRTLVVDCYKHPLPLPPLIPSQWIHHHSESMPCVVSYLTTSGFMACLIERNVEEAIFSTFYAWAVRGFAASAFAFLGPESQHKEILTILLQWMDGEKGFESVKPTRIEGPRE